MEPDDIRRPEVAAICYACRADYLTRNPKSNQHCEKCREALAKDEAPIDEWAGLSKMRKAKSPGPSRNWRKGEKASEPQVDLDDLISYDVRERD